MTLGRPVKFIASRRESFLSDILAREQTIHVEVAADGDGVLTAMRASITAAVGPYSAYPRSSVVEGGQVLRLLPGPYRLRHYDAALRVVAQNKVVTSQYRAVGHPIATAVTESMIDLVARNLGLDPAEVRRRNLIRPEELPYTSVTGNVFDSGSYQAALARLLEVAGYDQLRREQKAARAEGRYVGLGLSCFVELTGPGAQFYGVGGAPISGQEGTTLRLEPGGAITALVGVTNQGQGTHTALAQIIADELDVDLDDVSVLSGDTAVVPYGGGTWASRGMPIGGGATLLAARALGGALKEQCVYDDAGQLLSTTLMDYAVPTFADVPPIETHHIETPAPTIAGGFKGAGEAGATGAPAAILNAVNDALAPLGVMLTDQPITPERVVRALGGSR